MFSFLSRLWNYFFQNKTNDLSEVYLPQLKSQAKELPEDEAREYLESVFEAISDSFTEHAPVFSWRGTVTEEEATLEVFECATEVLGGADDGMRVYRGFCIDVMSLSHLFIPKDDEESGYGIEFDCDNSATDYPELLVFGRWRGINVHILIGSQPPDDADVCCFIRPDGTMVVKEDAGDSSSED